MIPLFLVAHGLQHFCGYEKEIANVNITMHSEKLISSKSLKGGAQWKNIRIHFDYRYLDGTRTDNQMCTRKGQQVVWQGYRYTCGSDDLLSRTQIQVIKGTFENVRSYLQRLLKVIPLTSSFKVISNQNYLVHTEIDRISNTDLYMAITARPRAPGESTLASAGSLATEGNYYRPYIGGVYLNPRTIPPSVQNENTKQSDFFYTCVHEIFHALGFASNHFPRFHPYEDRTPFSNPTCQITVKGKRMTFLTTPYARKYAKKHYGVTEFIGDGGSRCPAGIEIEDGGGGGTAGSHLEERTFMSEMMTGVTIQTRAGPFNRLTDASLAVLQDTGNYKCDYTIAKPLVWGNPESIDGKPIPNFGNGPWQLVFPEGYVYNTTYPYYTGFDYKFMGPASIAQTPSCNAYSNDYYCKARRFFNPKNGDIGPNPTFDYMPFKYPNSVCEKGTAMLPSTVSWSQRCGEYKCNGYESFTWRNYNSLVDRDKYETVTCTKGKAGKSFDSNIPAGGYTFYPRKLTCPDPERFCRTMKLYDSYFEHDPFDEKYKVLEPYPKDKPKEKPKQTPPPTPSQSPYKPAKPESSPINIPEKPTPIQEPDQPEETQHDENQPDTGVEQDDSSKAKESDNGKKKIDAGTIFFICLGIGIGIIVIALVALIVVKCRAKAPDSDDMVNNELTTSFIV